jgi:hypothetical protein
MDNLVTSMGISPQDLLNIKISDIQQRGGYGLLSCYQGSLSRRAKDSQMTTYLWFSIEFGLS